MSVAGLIRAMVQPMRDHLAKLDGDLGSAHAAADKLRQASTALVGVKDEHSRKSRTVADGWSGANGAVFGERVAAFDSAVTGVADNATQAGTLATQATDRVKAGRTAIEAEIDGFLGWATPVLQAATAAQNAGDEQAMLRAHQQCEGRAAEHAGRTSQELDRIRGELGGIAGQLRGLKAADVGALEGMGAAIGVAGPASTQQAGAAPSDSGSSGGSGSGSGAGSGGSGSGSGGSGTDSGGGGGGGGGGGSASKPHLPVAIPPQPGHGVDVNLPEGGTVQAPNEQAAQAVRKALTALGTPYVWAASNPPQGTDCSGLTQWAYADAGVDLPRHSSAQATGAEVPSEADLLPGDLVVWDGHVAMYIGEGQIIEAGDPVQIGPVRTTNSGMPFVGFYRPTG